MAEEQVVPKDIQDDADRLFNFAKMDEGFIKMGYIQGAMNERAKGIWTDKDMLEAMAEGYLRGQIDLNYKSNDWLEEYKRSKNI